MPAGLIVYDIDTNILNPMTGSMVDVNGINIGSNGNGSFQLTTNGLLKNQTANSIIIGDDAGLNLATTSFSNIMIGKDTGKQTVNGLQNTFVGAQAGLSNQNGSYNTCIGSAAGSQSMQDGNTFIGWNAGGNVAMTTVNTTCIGANAQPSTSNAYSEFTLGNNNVLALRCAVTSITSLSDARDKKEITELSAGLDFVNTLKPVEFVWDDRDEEGKHDIKDFGFIAQDLKQSQEDIELADTLKLVYEENPEKLEASYGKLIPILVKAIQDLSAKVEALESKKKK